MTKYCISCFKKFGRGYRTFRDEHVDCIKHSEIWMYPENIDTFFIYINDVGYKTI
jgi:hypothetical protein